MNRRKVRRSCGIVKCFTSAILAFPARVDRIGTWDRVAVPWANGPTRSALPRGFAEETTITDLRNDDRSHLGFTAFSSWGRRVELDPSRFSSEGSSGRAMRSRTSVSEQRPTTGQRRRSGRRNRSQQYEPSPGIVLAGTSRASCRKPVTPSGYPETTSKTARLRRR